MKNSIFRYLLLLILGLLSYVSQAQEYNNFEVRYQNNLRGDLTFIGNNILNRDSGTAGEGPNDPYNNQRNNNSWSGSNNDNSGFTNYNDYKNMQYIDVDSDPSTFSSSTSTFAFEQADCNLIRYAGLYWSATYPSATANGSFDGFTYNANTVAVGTGRQTDFNQVKFRVPGGAYIDITADEVLFDGFTSTDTSVQQNSPYACYADVTSIVTSLANPEGDYTVANIRATTGGLTPGGGTTGGWTLIIVYENPTLTGKFITTFDGFARVNGTNTVDIDYSGFETIPVGPVIADLGAATLEGDFRISGDGLSIEADSNTGFTAVGNTGNPTDNFFNSNITLDGVITTNRTPASTNTLGYDTDIFLLNNPTNSVIPNNETAATFRFSTNGDQYYPFFNSFNVEVIEPNIVLEKRVEDIAGNDITGAGVNLGQFLDYVLSFENIGNDDAINYTIRDILPINVTLDETNLNLPSGVTYTYTPATREVIFTIPDNLVDENDPASSIRMRVQVAENCFDFIDACTDQIENVAFSTYQGEINTAVITDDPSVNDFDTCGFVTPGATNFLLDDLDACDFSRTVQLCGDDVLLDAGDNFDAYFWYIDENNDGLIDAGDTLISGANTDTLLVTEVGTYIVDKQVADPCKGFQEIITVTLFGQTQSNPITALINDTSNTVEGQVVVCPNDGEELPEIFLCGLNDTELIQINIPDAQSIEWEQLDEASCTAATDDCANKNNTCTWNNVGNGGDFTASDAGQYRVVINYLNGCFSRFYFNIFKNPLDPQFNSSDIICNTPGNITVTNMPVDYEFQLVDTTNDNILVPYSANNGPSFNISTNGAYRVEMRQQGVTDGCVFILDNIGILDRDFQVDVVTRDTDCNGLGEISISVLNVEAQYYYEISQGGTSVDTFGPSNDNNYTFENLNDGVYDILVTTDDGCNYTEQVTINDVSDIAVSAITTRNIDCEDGIVTVTGTGGFPNPDYSYAIWSYVDESGTTITSYTDVSDIPAGEFQATNDFTFVVGEEGDYQFVVVDANNCTAISNIVTVEVSPAADFGPTLVVDVACFGEATGSITYNLINSNGYSLTYYLVPTDDFNNDNSSSSAGGITFTNDNTDVSSAIATNNSGTFINLPEGDYTVVINQSNGSVSCDYIENYIISAPAAPVSANAVLIQEYTCLQDGIIEAQNVAGGTAPYEYSIDGINFDGSAGADVFANLTDGTYNISIRDANNCVFVTPDIIIAPLNPPTDLTFTATNPVCPSLVSDVTATVVNGDAPFVFEIIAPSAIAATSTAGNSADFDALSPGTYTFRVTDDKGCIYEESFTINPVSPITVVGQLVSNITCFDDTDGEARFTVANFGTSYNYNVTGPSNFSGTNETNGTIDLTNLDDGTYTILVTDNDTNCTATTDVTINGPPAAISINVVETQPTCTTDGSAQITATGGWGSYTYTLNNPDTTPVATNTSGAFNGLTQYGVYNGTTTDVNGCVETFSFELFEAFPPVLVITPNDFCYDDATGLSLTATVTSGGDGNFEYSLNGGVFDTNNVFTGLGPGTYQIDVRDGNNCTDSETITINPELTVTASASNITACTTDTDINITAAGGDGNYVYSVVPDGNSVGAFSTTNPVTVTGAGIYDVYVRDNNGNAGFCEATFEITIVQDAPITITPTVTNITCFGDSTGSISIAASGGEAPYTYNIDGGTFQTGTDFLNLAAGTYAIIVRDANGCQETASVTVSQLDQIVAEATQTQNYTCTQDGEITVGSITSTIGGSGNYQYSINGGLWTASTTGGHTLAGLTDGTYSISVRDALNTGCIITLADVIIAPLPVEPTLSESVTYNCDGTGNITVLPNDPSYTYSLNAGAPQTSNIFNNVAVGNHVITVDYGSDCTTDINVVVEPGNAFEATITTFENLDCNGDNSGSISFDVDNFGVGGFEYSLDSFATAPLGNSTTAPVTISGLAAGNYTITVRDVDNPIAGCTITLNQTITQPALISVSNVLTQPTCIEDGSVIITATGGTGAYTYTIAQPNGAPNLGPQTSNTFTGLAEIGVHTITITDANGCIATDTFTTVASSNPTASIDAASDLCYSSSNAGSATIVVGATGGVAPYFYSINGGPLRTSNTFTDLIPGSYIFTVTDANGCTDDVAQDIEPQLTANLVLTKDLDCTASPDAVLTLNTSGGYSPFTYELNTNGGGYVSYTGSLPYVTASAGTYRFRVTDSQGCIAESNEIVVTPIVNPVATATATDPTCNGDTNGVAEINIDPSFGSSPFEVSFDGSPFSAQRVYAGLAAGTYSYTVRDSKSCTFTDTVTITDPVLFDANVVPTDVSCGASGDIPGSISITITSGGTPNYTYTLYDNLNNIVPVTGSNPIANTTATSVTFDGLAFGDYYVRVIDANGCEYYENPVRVLANPYLSVDAVVPAVSCITGGTVDLLASGGSGDYTFTIFGAGTAPDVETPGPGAGEESATYNGLNTGQTYIFQVVDNVTSCSSFVEVDIPALSAIDVVPNPITNDATCFGDTDGSIAFQFQDYDGTVTTIDYEIRESLTNTSLGVGYTGSVTGPPGPGPTPTVTISSIPPGDYILYFIEASNPSCSNTYDFRILEPSPVALNVIDQNNGNCNEDANITVIGSGGTSPYTYAFVEDGVTPVAGDYSSANYAELDATVNTDWDVYILDSRGCTIPNIDVTIANDPSPVISAVVLNQCAADEGDFIIEVTLDVAGVQPFNLSLDGGSFQSSTLVNAGDTYQFNNISSGTHTIEVRDFNGCENLVSVDVFPPTSITTEVTTQPTCLGNDGEVLITAYGGSGVFLYELFDSGGFSVGGTGSPQASQVFTGLNPGTYTAFVYDQVLAGCDAQVDVNLEIPTAVQFTTAPTAASCFGASDGTITVTLDPTSDNPPYTYQLFDVATGLIPQGPLQTSNIFTGLPAGDYRVRVFSGRGCQNDVLETVIEPLVITVPAPVVVEFGCTAGNNVNNASISINSGLITGGSSNYVIYEFIEEDDPNTGAVEAPVVVQSGANTTFIEVDPAGGIYTINVYDDNGCVGTTTATILPFDELLTATATFNNDLSCAPGNDGSITVTVTSTASDATRFEYSIDNGVNYQASNTFTGLTAGNYTILVRHIDTGCIISATETIEDPQVLDLDLVAVANVTCFGSATGSASFDLNNAGTTYAAAIDYTLYFDVNNTPGNLADDTVTNDSDTDGAFGVTGLLAGNYFIEVTEANFPNCTYSENFSVAGPSAAITGDTAVTEITCAPGNDGIIEVIDVIGGWGSYQYYVSTTPNPDEFDASNYVVNPRFENLTAGTYEIWVIDVNGCPEQLPDVTLANPTPIVADLQINNYNCVNLQGEIEVVGIPAINPVSGGQGNNYAYQLVRNGSNVGSLQNTTIFSGLGAGSYEVYILDQWGCDLLVGPVVLTDAMVATAAVVKPIDCTVSPDGEITITVTGGSSNLDYTVTYPDLTTTVSQNNGVFTGLSQPGEYVFVITDLDTATPCTYAVRQTLDTPVDPVLLDAIIEDVSCFGGSDGSITAVLDATTATNPNYTYELYRTSDLVTPIRVAQASPLFENLDADSYQVRVISARSCDDVKVEVVAQPNTLSASVSATPFACAPDNTVNTSTITITATDGTAPYLYSIDNVNFQTSHTFEIIDNGTAQTIDIYVADANGCSFTTDVTIQPLNTFTTAVALNNPISCANPEEVTITVTETGTPGNVYSFELLPIPNTNGVMTSSTNTSAVFDLSAVGNYTFRVTNTTTGCYVDTAPYEIAPFDLIDVVATATTPVSCFGTATGALEINITGYTGNYDYQIFDSSNNPVGGVVSTDTSINPRPVTNVPGGNYYVRVTETDVPLCIEDSNIITILSPAAALTTVVSIEAPVTCDNNQGEILVSPTGGYAPYDIVLTNTTTGQVYNIANVTSYLFDGLSAGSFAIDVSDNGSVPCVDSATETLVSAIPITADITATPTTLLCFGDTNATVSAINVLNGEGVYQYQLNEYDVTGTTIAFTSGGQISPDFNNLSAGIYSITVSDGWNCDVETAQVTISEPTDVMASLIQLTEMTCANNAQIQLSASGGTGPYEYSTDGSVYTTMSGGNSHTFSVADGIYQYYVRDSFGCEAMISNQITVDSVPPLTITIDDSAAFINCTGEASATIIANVTGGLGNYSYELFTDAALTNLVSGPQTDNTFSSLVAGSYYVRVTSQDCEEVSGEILIVDPAPLQIDREEFTDVTCFGLNDGTITVEVSGGTGEIQYAITPNLNQFDDVNTFNGLEPGVYDVIAQDRNGCFIPFQFTIDEPQLLDITTVSVMHEICEGDEDGSIEVLISGGTAPYSTAFNSNADADFIQDQTLFTDLAAGTYVIFVRDAQGCEENIIVEIESGVNLNAVVTPIYECSGDAPDNYIDVVLEDSSISADVLYGLDANPMQLAPDFTNIAPGLHTLTIAHANGCVNIIDFEIQDFEPLTLILEQNNINEITAIAGGGLEDYTFYFDGSDNGDDNTYIINRTDTYTVRVVDQNGCEMVAQIEMEFIDIEIPNFFTPDGDGVRDGWAPDNLEAFPNILTIIFDRYGRELYRMKLNTAPWEGNYQGHALPTGDYWYVIKLKGENDDREFVGHFTLYR